MELKMWLPRARASSFWLAPAARARAERKDAPPASGSGLFSRPTLRCARNVRLRSLVLFHTPTLGIEPASSFVGVKRMILQGVPRI